MRARAHHNASRICEAARAALATALLAAFATGCAFFNPDNTPLLNSVRDHLVPEKPVPHALASPVIYPLGVVAAMTDALVVHPALVIDDVVEDTRDALWDDWNWESRYVSECTKLPWRAAGTPIFFAGDLFVKGYFDVPDRVRVERRPEVDAAAALTAAREALEAERWEDAMKAVEPLLHRGRDVDDEWYDACRLHVEAAFGSGRPDLIDEHYLYMLINNRGEETADLVDRMLASTDYAMRWIAVDARVKTAKGADEIAEFARREIQPDPSAALRGRWLLTWGASAPSRYGSTFPESCRTLLEEMAENDPDPMNRALARGILRDAK